MQPGSSCNHFQLNSPSSANGCAGWCEVYFTLDGICCDSMGFLLLSMIADDVEKHASFTLYKCNFKSASNIGDRQVRIFSMQSKNDIH